MGIKTYEEGIEDERKRVLSILDAYFPAEGDSHLHDMGQRVLAYLKAKINEVR